MEDAGKAGSSNRLGFAHTHLFASFPPYRAVSIAAPVFLCVAALGFFLSPRTTHPAYPAAPSQAAASSPSGTPPGPISVSAADEQVCTSNDDPNEIIAACSRLIEAGTQSPHDVGVDYDRRGSAYLHENQFGPAITDLTAAIQAIPNDTNAYVDRADAEGNEGDVQAVLRDSGAALQIDPKNSNALTNEAEANLQLGYYDKAVQAATAGINLAPTANLYSIRGAAYGHENQFTQSIQDFTTAISLNPTDESYYESRGVSEYQSGDNTDAINDETTALRMNPNDANAQSTLQAAQKKAGQ
jgi:tetratricopeptide (TPR) repeat protein